MKRKHDLDEPQNDLHTFLLMVGGAMTAMAGAFMLWVLSDPSHHLHHSIPRLFLFWGVTAVGILRVAWYFDRRLFSGAEYRKRLEEAEILIINELLCPDEAIDDPWVWRRMKEWAIEVSKSSEAVIAHDTLISQLRREPDDEEVAHRQLLELKFKSSQDRWHRANAALKRAGVNLGVDTWRQMLPVEAEE